MLEVGTMFSAVQYNAAPFTESFLTRFSCQADAATDWLILTPVGAEARGIAAFGGGNGLLYVP